MQSSTYRTLLIQRQGQGFSEAEVTAVLQQVLLQLSQLHLQGKEHGAISLDTLAVTNGQVTLISVNSAQFQGGPAKDIYDLGMAMIELLTAKSPQVLFNVNSNQTWDDYCLVSDQLLEIINRMVRLSSQPRFTSATEVLPVLNVAVPATAISHHHNTTVISSAPIEMKQGKKDVFKKVPKWVWGLGISGGVIAVLLAVILPNLLADVSKAREARARIDLNVITQSQLDNYLKTGEFAASLSDLQLSFDENPPTDYEYTMLSPSANQSIVTAIPKRKKLKSFVGIVAINSDYLINSYVCQTEQPSQEAPQLQGITPQNSSCPPNFSYISRSNQVSVPQQFIPPPPRPEPTNFITEHYSMLNNRRYQETWERLTLQFQDKAENFSNYVNWWNQVRRIELDSVRLVDKNESQATVYARLQYYMNDGRIYDDPKRNIYLIWDERQETWKIHSKY